MATISIQSTDAASSKPSAPTSTPKSSPHAAEQGEFDRLMHRPDKRGNDGAKHDNPNTPDQPEDLSSLMGRLASERLGAPTAQEHSVAEVGASATSEGPDDMLDKLVQQILVSDPEQTGDSEVRLVVQESLLPDTEIHLSRGADGILSVTLATGQSGAFQTLVSAQTELRALLSAHEQQDVRLVVTNTNDSQTSDDASGRRSSNYVAYEEEISDQPSHKK
jgi:type III secretion system needle length determinant